MVSTDQPIRDYCCSSTIICSCRHRNVRACLLPESLPHVQKWVCSSKRPSSIDLWFCKQHDGRHHQRLFWEEGSYVKGLHLHDRKCASPTLHCHLDLLSSKLLAKFLFHCSENLSLGIMALPVSNHDAKHNIEWHRGKHYWSSPFLHCDGCDSIASNFRFSSKLLGCSSQSFNIWISINILNSVGIWRVCSFFLARW